ncbi:hypothetical protein BJQ94_12190 [Cryobacterium sp. SO2]|uniref:hypothetical protein n=1 Tax=Cryobacterium sp. SO2 TaxID=1897060 RepID=UPI00223E73D8|nr:hypothetical protein [Cryobacterium sp. SO2]WEO76131.1 hypothetical protein BJQ94_12190 [Cryobacterium sp. SO2]
MDDEELYGRLAGSAPAVMSRDESFRAAVDAMITSSRPARRRTRARRWLIGGAALGVVLLGGTSTALASPPLLEWLGFTPDRSLQHTNADGDFCVAGMIVRPEGVPADDASFLAAQEILLGIDFETVEVPDSARQDARASAAAAAKAAALAQYNAAHPEATIQPAPPDPETDALLSAAFTMMTDGVTARGLDTSHFSLEAGGTCDEVAR